ncbi:unnamed protein product, partial [Polarella glacialis]
MKKLLTTNCSQCKWRLWEGVPSVGTNSKHLAALASGLSTLASTQSQSKEAGHQSASNVFELKVLPALRWHRDRYGHLKVKRACVLPDIEEVPVLLRGYGLGVAVHNIRASGQFVKRKPERLKVLEELGFVWHANEFVWNKRLVPSLEWYKDRYGHLNVEYVCVLPDSEELPSLMRGFKLGRAVSDIRSSGDFAKGKRERLKVLEELGFVWDAKEFVWNKRLVPSLEWYKDRYGHLSVGTAYVLPDSEEVPCFLRGFSLGVAVNNIRAQGQFVKRKPERLKVLEELGFVWNANEFVWNKRLVPSLEWYKDRYGHLNVENVCVLPDSEELPSLMRGFRLGNKVHKIRSRGDFVNGNPERLKVLEELGFVWDGFMPGPSRFLPRHDAVLGVLQAVLLDE